jgi:hypothetical protein
MNPPPLFRKSQLRVLRSSLTNGTTRKESNDVSSVWSISGVNYNNKESDCIRKWRPGMLFLNRSVNTGKSSQIKKETKFSSYIRKFRWDWVQKVIYEEGLPNMWGNAQIFSPYMKKSLVIYYFAPNPSEFPNLWGKFSFLFLSVYIVAVYKRSLEAIGCIFIHE